MQFSDLCSNKSPGNCRAHSNLSTVSRHLSSCAAAGALGLRRLRGPKWGAGSRETRTVPEGLLLIMKKKLTLKITNIGQDIGKLKHLSFTGEHIKWCRLMENNVKIPQN